GLTLAAADLSPHWPTGIAGIPRRPGDLGPLGWFGVALTLITGGWLIAVLIASTRRVARSRRAHRSRLDLVADELVVREDSGRSLALVRLLEHDAAVAYCLPGLRPQIVLSRGTIDALRSDELAAVVRHEQAHARGQHDLVIHPFRAWRETFPFLPAAAQALGAVELLVEMLADDAARRRSGDGALLEALLRLAADHPDDHDLSVRIARLARPSPPLSHLTVGAVYLGAVILVAAPPALLALT
ncbi:MAG TPA: M56 family metallopeptidase, partial [Micromonosporaceae bacterium]